MKNKKISEGNKKVKSLIWTLFGILFIAGFAIATTTITDNSISSTGNVTAQYFCNSSTCYSIADFLVDLTGTGNLSWNQSLADSLYAPISVSGDNSTWNQSLADTLYSPIGTGGNATFNQTLTDSLYAPIGSGNASFNQSLTDVLYAPISVSGDNSTWNQSLADTLYAAKQWDYNMSDGVGLTSYTNIAMKNQTNTFTPQQVFSAQINTSNIYIGSNKLCGDSACTKYIYYNGTAWVGQS